ncbi:hypothetical protein OFM36_39595, partial [Escherichia coli]|nr:hypothetical protein [Escherichia coli]
AGAVTVPAPAARGALADTTVWFTRNFRFSAEGGIGRLAAEVNAGRADEALAWLREGRDPAVRWVEDGGAELAPDTWA